MRGGVAPSAVCLSHAFTEVVWKNWPRCSHCNYSGILPVVYVTCRCKLWILNTSMELEGWHECRLLRQLWRRRQRQRQRAGHRGAASAASGHSRSSRPRFTHSHGMACEHSSNSCGLCPSSTTSKCAGTSCRPGIGCSRHLPGCSCTTCQHPGTGRGHEEDSSRRPARCGSTCNHGWAGRSAKQRSRSTRHSCRSIDDCRCASCACIARRCDSARFGFVCLHLHPPLTWQISGLLLQ